MREVGFVEHRALQSQEQSTTFAIVHTVADLRAGLCKWRSRDARIGLVPTMGALHAGHMSLVAAAREQADRIVTSIFVNPTQFAPTEDFGAYPRSLEADAEKLAAAGCDLVFAPRADAMYPEGFATMLEPGGPAKVGLEDKFRPTHFAGVATIVAKLLVQCRPDIAVFGEKDYQQLKVVERLVRDLDFETRIVAAPTVREPDRLALSSRNAYLSADERARAPRLHAALARCADEIRMGRAVEAALKSARSLVGVAGFVTDYLEARHAETLAMIASLDDGPIRLLVAARLGRTRLLDNLPV
jgi:pantoate--beta-alanine ligase